MAFKRHKDIGQVLATYQLSLREAPIFDNHLQLTAPERLVDDIDFIRDNMAYKSSEAATCEMIIFPLLKEAWRARREGLMLWSHVQLTYTDDQNKPVMGFPDYIIARKSPLANVVMDKPLLAVIEAKKDDFTGGWAQCTVEMVGMQKINQNPEMPIYGIVTNGTTWEFAKLQQHYVTQHPKIFTISSLDELYSTLVEFMELCATASQNFSAKS